NVTNGDADANHEYVVLEFNALVCNIDPSGAAIANTFRVTAYGTTETSGPVWVKVVEPHVALAKTAVVELGTATTPPKVAYTVTLTNTGTGDAFDLAIGDVLVNGAGLSVSTYDAGSI